MLCRLCVIASFDGSPWVLPHAHAWVLLPLYTVCCTPYFILICHALRILPHGWVLPLLYTICYALWILLHAWVPPLLYTNMLCTADTTTCLGIAIALYYIILCYALRIPPHPWTLPSLYTICYALLILPHA